MVIESGHLGQQIVTKREKAEAAFRSARNALYLRALGCWLYWYRHIQKVTEMYT